MPLIQSSQAELEKRFMIKWDALIVRDFVAMYSLPSPAYRECLGILGCPDGQWWFLVKG